jgi:Protein of unknown function (DUF3224)
MLGSRRRAGRHAHPILRRGAASLSLAALVIAVAAVPPAFAGSGGREAHRANITFTTASGPPVSFAPACDASGACLLPVSGGPESTVTGDFQGTGVYAGAARLIGANEAISSAIATFTGSVKGCGEGTNTIRYDAHYGADRPNGGGGTWKIVPGLGTGDLRDMTGHGTFTVGTTNPDLSGTNNFKGQIRCTTGRP